MSETSVAGLKREHLPLLPFVPLAVVSALGMLFPGCASPAQIEPAAAESAESAVRRAFVEYQDAIKAGDGASAAALVDRKTHDWYGRIVVLARTLNRAELKRLVFPKKVAVLLCRQLYTPRELATVTGERLLARILGGTSMGSEVTLVRVGTIRIDGERAALRFEFTDEPKPDPPRELFFVFVSESESESESGWKLALSENFRRAEIEMESLQETSDDELVKVVEAITGTPVTTNLFELKSD